jgi:nicotinamide-nucleotide amidase
MKVSTLSIGDEVLFGEITDTNSAHIATRLYDEGFMVHRHLCVGDNESDIMEVIEALAGRNDFIVASGGLGPTVDDITARAAAKAAGRPLVLNDEALAHLRRFYEKLGREMFPAAEKQCLLPAKAALVPNPVGTACGFVLPYKGTYFFFLPGVPKEMKRMLEETVLPAIRSQQERERFVRTRVFRVFGLSESQTEALVKEVARPADALSVAYCVNFPEVFVKLRIEGNDEARLSTVLEEGCIKMREKLGEFLVAEGDDTIDSVVARLFRQKGTTLSLAESCTGGLIAKRITDMSGSSSYFLEGAVTYSNSAKTRVLDVPAGLIVEKGAVSSAVAMAMARGIRRKSGSDVGLAVTGVAGPEGGTEEKPVGTVYLALAGPSDCKAKHYKFFGDRERIRTIAAFTAMDWLRRYLLAI